MKVVIIIPFDSRKWSRGSLSAAASEWGSRAVLSSLGLEPQKANGRRRKDTTQKQVLMPVGTFSLLRPVLPPSPPPLEDGQSTL
jgi:hypothetical protein